MQPNVQIPPGFNPGQPAYDTTCPHCGGALQPIALDPATAPWLCVACHIGWWTTELQADVRVQWIPASQSFHWRAVPWLISTIDQEQAAAASVGTSARADQLALFSLETLQTLSSQPTLNRGFQGQVGAMIAQKTAPA